MVWYGHLIHYMFLLPVCLPPPFIIIWRREREEKEKERRERKKRRKREGELLPTFYPLIDGRESSPIFWDYFDCLEVGRERETITKWEKGRRKGNSSSSRTSSFSFFFLHLFLSLLLHLSQDLSASSCTAIKILVRDKYHLARDLASGLLFSSFLFSLLATAFFLFSLISLLSQFSISFLPSSPSFLP